MLGLLPGASPCAPDPVFEAFTAEHAGQRFDVARIEPEGLSNLRFFWRRSDGNAYGSISGLRESVEANGEKLRFATNGGIYARSFEPLGLYVENGRKLQALNKGRGGGNFFLKPNGVFGIADRGAFVVETDRFRPRKGLRQAVQSGPMLVINGRLHPRFIPDSDSRFVRNGVGVDAAGRVVFAISRSVVNFHDFGTLFRDALDCPNALYLDGKISRAWLPELGRFALLAWKPFVSMIGYVEPGRD